MPSTIECDSSDFVNAGCLSQPDADGVLRPVAFFSRRLNPAECNYDIYDKELMAIVRAFEEWRSELEGAGVPVEVLSDHKNLQSFMTTKRLNRRQARWSEFLSRFNFRLIYRPGAQGGKPDALTRRSSDCPQGEDDERQMHQHQTILRPENVSPGMAPISLHQNTVVPETHEEPSLEELITKAYERDPIPSRVIEALRKQERRLPQDLTRLKLSLADCTEQDGRLLVRHRLYVPEDDELRLRLLQLCHDNVAAGHPGKAKTHELLSRDYFWPRMVETVRRYIRNCHTCSQSKTSRLQYQGLLQPLEAPTRRWEDIAIDFIVDLPRSKNETTGQTCRNILVVTDRLSKQRHFIGCGSMEAKYVARLFLHHVWKHHGLPRTIVSDRGTQFVSKLWQRVCQRLGITTKLSTAYHPETDGQSENSNQGLEQYLRAYVNYLQNDWVNWLPMAEFAINNHQSETTKVTPFYAVYGQHPRMGHEPPQATRRLPAPQQLDVAKADQFADAMKELTNLLHDELKLAQADYANQADRTRFPAPAFQEGDRVWLDTRNLKMDRPSRKLAEKYIGPFKIIKVVSPVTYRLDLPTGMSIHNVFHVNLLRAAGTDPLPGQQTPRQTTVRVETDKVGAKEWLVEDILKS
jgi:transposase InsO family protein